MSGGLQKLQRGTYSDRGDQNAWTYYDTLTLSNAAGAQTFRLFQTPWSGTKSKDLTNMKTAGQMPANQRFRITSIGIQYVAAAARTTLVKINTLLASVVGELIINGKDASYQKTLAHMLGMSFVVENATGAANIVTQPVFDLVKEADKLKFPVVLAANVPFEFDLVFTAASDATLDGDKIKIALNGTLIRAM